MDLWNERSIACPPTVRIQYGREHMPRPLTDAVNKTLALLRSAVTELRDRRYLSTEYYVLSRLIYRSNNQMRREKLLHTLKQVQKCLKRLQEVNLLALMENLQESFPSVSEMAIHDVVHLPSMSMVEYGLVRLQGTSVLLAQTIAYCVHAYLHAYEQLTIGVFIPNMIVFISLISRLWALCRALLQPVVQWYNSLKELALHLQAARVQWLPDGVMLPSALGPWLKERGFVWPEPKTEMSTPGSSQLDALLSRFADGKTPSAEEVDALVSPAVDRMESDSVVPRASAPLPGNHHTALDVGHRVKRKSEEISSGSKLPKTESKFESSVERNPGDNEMSQVTSSKRRKKKKKKTKTEPRELSLDFSNIKEDNNIDKDNLENPAERVNTICNMQESEVETGETWDQSDSWTKENITMVTKGSDSHRRLCLDNKKTVEKKKNVRRKKKVVNCDENCNTKSPDLLLDKNETTQPTKVSETVKKKTASASSEQHLGLEHSKQISTAKDAMVLNFDQLVQNVMSVCKKPKRLQKCLIETKQLLKESSVKGYCKFNKLLGYMDSLNDFEGEKPQRNSLMNLVVQKACRTLHSLKSKHSVKVTSVKKKGKRKSNDKTKRKRCKKRK